MSDVWVTGLGLRSAAGNTISDFGDALTQNRFCGYDSQSELDVSHVARVLDAENEYDALFPDDRKCTLGYGAALDALKQSKLDGLSDTRSVIYLGTGLSSITPDEFEVDIFPHLDNGKLSRQTMSEDLRSDLPSPNRHLPNRFAAVLAERLGHTGLVGTNFSACAAAAQAMAEVFTRGVVRLMWHWWVDMTAWIIQWGCCHFSFWALCLRNIVVHLMPIGTDLCWVKGLPCLSLSVKHMHGREVKPLAKISGAGTSIDANNATAPHEEGMGAALAMRRAMRFAGLKASDIGYVNAHGTDTSRDVAESLAIQRVLWFSGAGFIDKRGHWSYHCRSGCSRGRSMYLGIA